MKKNVFYLLLLFPAIAKSTPQDFQDIEIDNMSFATIANAFNPERLEQLEDLTTDKQLTDDELIELWNLGAGKIGSEILKVNANIARLLNQAANYNVAAFDLELKMQSLDQNVKSAALAAEEEIFPEKSKLDLAIQAKRKTLPGSSYNQRPQNLAQERTAIEIKELELKRQALDSKIKEARTAVEDKISQEMSELRFGLRAKKDNAIYWNKRVEILKNKRDALKEQFQARKAFINEQKLTMERNKQLKKQDNNKGNAS